MTERELLDDILDDLDCDRCPECHGRGEVFFGDKISGQFDTCGECEGQGDVPKGRYDP